MLGGNLGSLLYGDVSVMSLVLLFLFEGVPLPRGAWEKLRYFIVALTGPSI